MRPQNGWSTSIEMEILICDLEPEDIRLRLHLFRFDEQLLNDGCAMGLEVGLAHGFQGLVHSNQEGLDAPLHVPERLFALYHKLQRFAAMQTRTTIQIVPFRKISFWFELVQSYIC